MTHYIKQLSALLIIILVTGCAPKPLLGPEDPIDFQFITVQQGQTLASLAENYIGAADLAWRIAEFNGIDQLQPGQQLIIPRHPFRKGGLTANGYQVIPVLSYHHFQHSHSDSKMVVSAATFEQQLNYLKDNGYHVIRLEQLYDFLNLGQVPQKSVLITIDDGWSSSYKIAYPLLKQFRFNASLFIPTQFIDSGSKNALSWQQINEITSDKIIDVQCHTKSHRDLSTYQDHESFAEYIHAINHDIVNSGQVIYQKTGQRVSALAYPFGNTNTLVMALLKKRGYKSGFTVNREGNSFFQQNYLLNRSMIYGTFHLAQFIENLKTFEAVEIGKEETIDRIHPLSSIAALQPEQLEREQQWRTALLAWKLRRDKLMTQLKQNFATDPSKDNKRQPLYRELSAAKQKVTDITKILHDLAFQKYREALARAADPVQSRKFLLQSLLYDADNQAVLEYFKKGISEQTLLSYQVKKQDTFASIAKEVFHDAKKSILIPIFNESVKQDRDLVVGMQLELPSLPRDLQLTYPSVTAGCHIDSSKSPEILASEYYDKAIDQFNNDNISGAIETLNTVICINPDHAQAKEMLEMLKSL